MGVEIERKFLVKSKYYRFITKHSLSVEEIRQGYLVNKTNNVRVRVSEKTDFDLNEFTNTTKESYLFFRQAVVQRI
jgi:CYTH domain-containing protein